MSPRPICCLIAVALALGARGARALPAATDPQLAAARDTFAAAEKDEDAERWSDALAKLRSVAAVRFTAGVRYHVALCEEHTGQLVEALADYTEADRQARSEGTHDVLKLVGARIADVAGRLPHMNVRVLAAPSGAVATIDGQPCADPLCTAQVTLDPGPHRVEANAPDHVPASTTVTLHEREVTAVDLVLVPVAPPAAPPRTPLPAPAPQTSRGATRGTAMLAGIGAVVLATGGLGAYVAAGSELASGIRSCRQLVTPTPGSCDGDRNTVRALDWTAAGAWLGAAALGTIAVLTWNGARAESAPAPSTSVVFGPTSAGLAGTF